MVEGGGAARTGKPGSHMVSGGTGDVIVGHHWGAHRLQGPVGGGLPANGTGGLTGPGWGSEPGPGWSSSHRHQVLLLL